MSIVHCWCLTENTQNKNKTKSSHPQLLRQAYLLWLRVMPLTNFGDVIGAVITHLSMFVTYVVQLFCQRVNSQIVYLHVLHTKCSGNIDSITVKFA